MIILIELQEYLEQLLEPAKFTDYCPNGLQVAGRNEIHTLVTGVTACQQLLDKAVAEQADAILVHHGYFWRQENPVITGIKQRRLKTLLQHDISLLAYHLPLDVHESYGNNVQLAKRLAFEVDGFHSVGQVPRLLCSGFLQRPLAGEELAAYIAHQLGRSPLHIPGVAKPIRTIAWCTGAAQDLFEQAIGLGVDAFLTGEITERTVHIARETGIHFFAAGHHATERYGVQELGEHLAHYFGIQHHYIEIPNPV